MQPQGSYHQLLVNQMKLVLTIVSFYKAEHFFNVNASFNNHYSDISNEVYKAFVPQGSQKIPDIKVRGLKKPSVL